MEILVCVRRVPDTSENEIQLNSAGDDIERDDLVYSINEADNYAVEEALQIVARVGGNVTVATVGGEDDEEVLRRERYLEVGRKQVRVGGDDVARPAELGCDLPDPLGLAERVDLADVVRSAGRAVA